jgi:hypothetical protein
MTKATSEQTHIVGNPPYIRWEAIPLELRKAYRNRYPSFKGRADLYVAFIDRALDLLTENGQLGFLCPGAWTRNGYGGSPPAISRSSKHWGFVQGIATLLPPEEYLALPPA